MSNEEINVYQFLWSKLASILETILNNEEATEEEKLKAYDVLNAMAILERKVFNLDEEGNPIEE